MTYSGFLNIAIFSLSFSVSFTSCCLLPFGGEMAQVRGREGPGAGQGGGVVGCDRWYHLDVLERISKRTAKYASRSDRTKAKAI